MRKRIISLLLMLAFICCMSKTVFAAEVPDMAQKGKITVTMRAENTIVPGGEMTLYRVGEIYEDDGNYSFIPTGAFKNCVKSFEDVQSPELASQLAEYAKKLDKNVGVTKTISQKGVVTFTDQELGLYLLVQTEAADGYNKADPFLVSLPKMENGKYSYEVDASPKVNIKQETKDKKTPTPRKNTSKLPQTGQLNWPIPVLAVSGMGLFAIGWILYFGRKKNENET